MPVVLMGPAGAHSAAHLHEGYRNMSVMRKSGVALDVEEHGRLLVYLHKNVSLCRIRFGGPDKDLVVEGSALGDDDDWC